MNEINVKIPDASTVWQLWHELFSNEAGMVQSELLAYTESHGRTIEWLR